MKNYGFKSGLAGGGVLFNIYEAHNIHCKLRFWCINRLVSASLSCASRILERSLIELFSVILTFYMFYVRALKCCLKCCISV